MKVQTVAVDEIERIGIGTEQAFRINFDAKMARILADGLYSDKVQSVIRELSCNAWDSHVMAGKADTPFLVHFPTALEAWFSVQDFGTGLNHQQVLDIYTCYGASTKTTSNEVIGQLGLGSKSPFALTTAFTVIARKDGVENHYSMYRNEQGMPTVAHLGENPTTEPNGVTVQVPVRAEQRREFIDKAREVYKWFPLKPRFVGIDNLDIPTMEWAYQGTGWRIRKSERRGWGYNSRPRPMALMGMVAYPLDANLLHDISTAQRAMLTLGALLEFDIGDLEVAANREALGYDDRTVANIKAKLSLMLDELGAQFEQQISTAPTEYEARRRFGEIFSHDNEFNYEFREAFGQRGLHWGKLLIKEDSIKVPITDLYPLDKDKKTTDNIYFSHDGAGSRRPKRIYHVANDYMRIRAEARTEVFFDDLERGGIGRVHEFNKNLNYAKHCYVFGPHQRLTPKKISRLFGGVPVKLTSSLPKPVRAKPERRTQIMLWKGEDGKAKAWDHVEYDLNQGGYYVELDGWDVKMDENKTTIGLVYLTKLFKRAKLIPENAEIYAMRGKNRELVRNDANWKELFSTALDALRARITTQNLAQSIADANEYSALARDMSWHPWDTQYQFKMDTSPMQVFCDHVRHIRDAMNRMGNNEAIEQLAQRFDIDLGKAQPTHQLWSEWQQIRRRYPMLDFIGGRYHTVSEAEARRGFEYVDFVDVCEPFYRIERAERAVDSQQ